MGLEKFTKSEDRVLDFLQENSFATDQQIADNLSVSINTVRMHLKNMYKKRGLSGHNCRFKLQKIKN